MLRNHLANSSLFQPWNQYSLVSRPVLRLAIPQFLTAHDNVSGKHSGTVIDKFTSPIIRRKTGKTIPQELERLD